MEDLSGKLRLVLEAEEKARKTLDEYRRSAGEILERARERAGRLEEEAVAEARARAERMLAEMVARARREAEELRWEYMFERARLLAEVSTRRREAVDFLVRGLMEKGEA